MNQLGHAKVCDEARAGKPYSGKLYVRFDEGSGVTPAPTLLQLSVSAVSFFQGGQRMSTLRLYTSHMNDTEKIGFRGHGSGVRTPIHHNEEPVQGGRIFVPCLPPGFGLR